MEILTGHLTGTEKKAIRAILEGNTSSGRVGKKDYILTELSKDEYMVKILQVDRGMIPCPGSPLRISTYTSTFRI